MYWRSARIWYALERASGPRFRRLTGRWTAGRTVLAEGSGWAVAMTVQEGRARFEYVPRDTSAKPAESAWLPVDVGGPAEIDLVTDESTGELQLAVTGDRLLDLWLVPAGGPVSVSSSWTDVPVRAPFC